MRLVAMGSVEAFLTASLISSFYSLPVADVDTEPMAMTVTIKVFAPD